jgi:hypothetical protein
MGYSRWAHRSLKRVRRVHPFLDCYRVDPRRSSPGIRPFLGWSLLNPRGTRRRS